MNNWNQKEGRWNLTVHWQLNKHKIKFFFLNYKSVDRDNEFIWWNLAEMANIFFPELKLEQLGDRGGGHLNFNYSFLCLLATTQKSFSIILAT